jgi:poly(A) polymerase
VLYGLGPALFRDVVNLSWARSKEPLTDRGWRTLLKLADRWPIPKLPVTGHDLIAAGLPPGPELGQALERLGDWWIAADFAPDRDELLQRMRK